MLETSSSVFSGKSAETDEVSFSRLCNCSKSTVCSAKTPRITLFCFSSASIFVFNATTISEKEIIK